VVNELTRADVTAVTVFQATLPVPGRRLPKHPGVLAAVRAGEARFQAIGCATCHVPSLPLDQGGWIFTEPNPHNPPGNLRPGEAPALSVDLTREDLPPPRLKVRAGIVPVPAYTDLKLHDITCGPGDPNREPLDLHRPPGGARPCFAANARFLTKKLWGFANEPPFFHHGQFTTIREAILAHCGEARAAREAFQGLGAYEQATLIDFLKTMQVLPPGTRRLVIKGSGGDERE
jgi:CxxC motif-containing protein (DUF1111 family)